MFSYLRMGNKCVEPINICFKRGNLPTKKHRFVNAHTVARCCFNPCKSCLNAAPSHDAKEWDGGMRASNFIWTPLFRGFSASLNRNWVTLLGDLLWPAFCRASFLIYHLCVWFHQTSDIPPAPWHLPLASRLVLSLQTHMYCHMRRLFSVPCYVGHTVKIDGYFQCLGPQEISLGNFQKYKSAHFPASKLEQPISLLPCLTQMDTCRCSDTTIQGCNLSRSDGRREANNVADPLTLVVNGVHV